MHIDCCTCNIWWHIPLKFILLYKVVEPPLLIHLIQFCLHLIHFHCTLIVICWPSGLTQNKWFCIQIQAKPHNKNQITSMLIAHWFTRFECFLSLILSCSWSQKNNFYSQRVFVFFWISYHAQIANASSHSGSVSSPALLKDQSFKLYPLFILFLGRAGHSCPELLGLWAVRYFELRKFL